MAPHHRPSFEADAETFRTYCQNQFETSLDYSFESVAFLDAVLTECNAQLATMTPQEATTFVHNTCHAAGAYLGQVLVQNAGAQWKQGLESAVHESWWIDVPNARTGAARVDVFAACRHALQNGLAVSLLDLVMPYMPHVTAPLPTRA